jgi:hypothetical protein
MKLFLLPPYAIPVRPVCKINLFSFPQFANNLSLYYPFSLYTSMPCFCLYIPHIPTLFNQVLFNTSLSRLLWVRDGIIRVSIQHLRSELSQKHQYDLYEFTSGGAVCFSKRYAHRDGKIWPCLLPVWVTLPYEQCPFFSA